MICSREPLGMTGRICRKSPPNRTVRPQKEVLDPEYPAMFDPMPQLHSNVASELHPK